MRNSRASFGLLMSVRNLGEATTFVRALDPSRTDLDAHVEASKKNFVGSELAGKTLGVIGLGAIGVKVANAAHALGMTVLGFDPHMTVEGAWRLTGEGEFPICQKCLAKRRGSDLLDRAAPSDESHCLPGLKSWGHTSGASVRMSGTSVAAPLAARELAQFGWMSGSAASNQECEPQLQPRERLGS